MKASALRWLALLLLPGCILVQPLDEAKPAEEGSAGSTQAGNGSAAGGSKNNAGSGNPGGSANGGSANGTDFSLFTSTWLVQSGSIDRSCSDGEKYSDPVNWDADEIVEGGGGSSGDILLDPGAPCQLAFDVDDRIATALPGQSCTTYDSSALLTQQLDFKSGTFAVGADESRAMATAQIDETLTNAAGQNIYCDTSWTIYYQRDESN